MSTDEEAAEREQKEHDAKNQAVLDKVKALVSPEAFEQIEESLSEYGFAHSYKIVGKPVGRAQDEGFVLGEVYVDQTTNGGFSGDDFAGSVCMPIAADCYFQYAYNC
tara:strand:+ start:805 stop:1125 length:321 start_codon:yes stop_codon:yes gene_type:complete